MRLPVQKLWYLLVAILNIVASLCSCRQGVRIVVSLLALLGKEYLDRPTDAVSLYVSSTRDVAQGLPIRLLFDFAVRALDVFFVYW